MPSCRQGGAFHHAAQDYPLAPQPNGDFVICLADLDADSDEVAWAFRDDVARDYEMMSPGFGASLACILFALGRCRSSVLDNV